MSIFKIPISLSVVIPEGLGSRTWVSILELSKASIPTNGIAILKNRRCRNQNSMTFALAAGAD